jgi:hypothetical protein
VGVKDEEGVEELINTLNEGKKRTGVETGEYYLILSVAIVALFPFLFRSISPLSPRGLKLSRKE